jgi:hypothetical protein
MCGASQKPSSFQASCQERIEKLHYHLFPEPWMTACHSKLKHTHPLFFSCSESRETTRLYVLHVNVITALPAASSQPRKRRCKKSGDRTKKKSGALGAAIACSSGRSQDDRLGKRKARPTSPLLTLEQNFLTVDMPGQAGSWALVLVVVCVTRLQKRMPSTHQTSSVDPSLPHVSMYPTPYSKFHHVSRSCPPKCGRFRGRA